MPPSAARRARHLVVTAAVAVTVTFGAGCGAHGANGNGAPGGPPTGAAPAGADAAASPAPAPDGAAAGRLAPQIPDPTGPCPDFATGMATFAPAGVPPRPVRLWVTEAARTKKGPLVFYWHGTGSRPEEAAYTLGAELQGILDAGGIVAAPTHDPAAGLFPWYAVLTPKDDDLRVADEVLACAARGTAIDVRRVHSMGMSAGGLQTTQMGFQRSAYVASVVILSGGLPSVGAPPAQEPRNRWAAMIFHGGPKDVVFGFDFQAASERLRDRMNEAEHFTLLCNHGRGHAVPTTAAPAMAAFLAAHPFGVTSPWAGAVPDVVPASCGR